VLQSGAAPLILASASTSRARILAAAGVPVDQRPAAIDEAEIKGALRADGVAPGDAALALAELKAQRIAGQAPGGLVLGADQILTCEGTWFDKARDLAEARAQLAALAGRRHELWTAAIVVRDGARLWHEIVQTRLWLRPCSDAFLDAYLEAVGEAALSAVGAYHVEGLGAQLFARVEGDRFAIQGLPLFELLECLRVQGVLLR
jgi:nucleoside triphosphate pyrophosphatase